MSLLRTALTAVVLTAAVVPSLDAQGIGSRLRQRAAERANAAADRAMEKALDKVEGAITCAVTDSQCMAKAEAAGQKPIVTDESGQPLPENQQQAARDRAAQANRPNQGAWRNFDFVPGERVLWADDFSSERVGNFPRRLEFRNGAMELIESNGRRFVSGSSGYDVFTVTLPEALPQRFTMEFDVTIPEDWHTTVFFSDEGVNWQYTAADGGNIPTANIFIAPDRAGVARGNGDVVSARPYTEVHIDPAAPAGQLVRMRVHVDGTYAKVYINEVRVGNVPNVQIPRTNKVYFLLQGKEDAPMLIGNISINAGGLTMYDALMADGRIATQGIYFDTGSDRIRPESSGTLNEIATMLKEHGDLRIRIEGHTDNVGQAAANQTLSDRRAAAVKAALVEMGIASARLETQGLGQTKPVAPNDTAEGRQSNRRVELVKL